MEEEVVEAGAAASGPAAGAGAEARARRVGRGGENRWREGTSKTLEAERTVPRRSSFFLSLFSVRSGSSFRFL